MKFTSLLLPLLLSASPLLANEIKLYGTIHADRDISAAAFFGSTLLIGSDEAVGNDENENYIQLLEPSGSSYQIKRDILVYRGNKNRGRELDIEAIAIEGNHIYVAGSHALARKRIKAGKSTKENIQRLATIKPEPARKQIIRLSLDHEQKVVESSSISVAGIIANDPILAPFATIPSKENGIDIEGMAVKNGQLFLGFRAPVLRDGFVPVLQTSYDNPEKDYRLHWLNLNGLSIRDMVTVADGFLILAAPVGDIPHDFRIYHWNGVDSLTDRNGLKLLQKIDPPKDGKAEAVAIEGETAKAYNVLLLFDGIKGGSPRRYTIDK